MKTLKFILLIGLFSLSATLFSQSFLGKYTQVSIIAPDEYRDSAFEVVIDQDLEAEKKIWVKNLIPNQTFYAVKYVAEDETAAVYTVPPQLVGDYQIKLGCVIFETDDEQETSVVINLNNEAMCKGISQKDFQTDIQVGDNKVKVGDVEVDGNGNVKAGEDVEVDSEKGVNVNTKVLMSGIQYVGQKL
ncbi:MAG: hypothetical protein CR968_04760 [Flavobacteriia bacterium]|nr:MAG: hypothetical protein CR968_04760 [Flavobacteriia bacterium]